MADGSSSPAYEQFCLLAKSQRGRAVVALIQQVTLNLFSKLASKDNMKELNIGTKP